jgi:cytochrome c oxidase subunit 4
MADPHSHPPAHGPSYDVAKDVDTPGALFAVYLVVLGLFAVTFFVSTAGVFGKYTLFFQLAVATVQAGVVAYYFMHLRQGDRVVTLTALASVFWTLILFVLFMSDYMTRHRVVTGW